MNLTKKNFPGTLVLVVGNSGSGKDSIISGAIKKFPSNLKKVYLAKRFITRPPSEFEENYCISAEQFKIMDEQGKFALKWHIYGLDYGVAIEIDDWLQQGHPVIVNVSRNIVEFARRIYENIKVVFVQVPFDITQQRVKNRGREGGDLLNERIERAKSHQEFMGSDFTVDNSGNLDNAIEQFLSYLIYIENGKKTKKNQIPF